MNRRNLFQASAATLFGLPLRRAFAAAPPLPDPALFASNPEQYWQKIRAEQFFPFGKAYLNNGSLGVAPRPVVDAVTSYLTRAASIETPSYPRWGYETLDAEREELAAYVGCSQDELAIMHNATEAMSTIAAGLELNSGDEVIITDQEHPSGRSGWLMRQARYGVRVREIPIPVTPKNPGEVADRLVSAMGPSTKVLSFSGITTTTGLILPVKEICRAAKANGVITVVDGAHMHGQVPVRIADLGCDFMAGSPHKWMFAPAGCGLLYIRSEMQDRLWPAIVTGGWDTKSLKAGRYMRLGTNNYATIEGMMAGLRFGRAIGHQRIYARVHELARFAFEKARAIPYIQMITPDDDRSFGALVSMEFKKDAQPLWALCNKRKIWSQQSQRIRLSTHIHTRKEDIELFFSSVREALG